MIRGFKHRGLKRLYERGDRAGIRPDPLETVEDILGRLDRVTAPQAGKLDVRLQLSGFPERLGVHLH
jgi:hypothetical protein